MREITRKEALEISRGILYKAEAERCQTGNTIDSDRARVTELEAQLADLREKAAWYLECHNTKYAESQWPLGWYHIMFMAQQARRKSEFFDTVAKSERDLRAAIGEG